MTQVQEKTIEANGLFFTAAEAVIAAARSNDTTIEEVLDTLRTYLIDVKKLGTPVTHYAPAGKLTTVYYAQVMINNKWRFVAKAPFYTIRSNAETHARVYMRTHNERVQSARAVAKNVMLDELGNIVS